jgi:hypothetical protein
MTVYITDVHAHVERLVSVVKMATRREFKNYSGNF